ncbi:MAG: hypothetical protein GXO07_04230 [Crenarchaeota archaeon]|nr:hypothetical protein [Thermoproteota archaeon]
MERVGAVGGLDPSGGAGIEMDVKVGSAIGVYVHPVATALTYQTPTEFYGSKCVDLDVLESQLSSLKGVRFWKLGMLCNDSIADVLAKRLEGVIVVDPVLRASAGGELYSGSLDAYLKLISKSFAVTPNVPEAEALTGIKVKSLEDAVEAAKALSKMGPELVIVTGGHLDKLADVIYYKGEVEIITGSKKLPVHGSGSFMAMSLASYLALGYSPKSAARTAIGFTRLVHAFALEVAGGRVPDPFIQLRYNAERHYMSEEYKYFIEWLTSLPYEVAKRIAPEVGINIAFSVPKELVRGKGSIIGLPGRLHLTPRGLRHCCCPWWGTADHTARLLMEAQKYNPKLRVAMNVRYSEENVERLRRAGYEVYELRRETEPPGWESMRWAVKKAYDDLGRVPHVIYDKGFYGKEAMIRLLAEGLDRLKKMVLTLVTD